MRKFYFLTACTLFIFSTIVAQKVNVNPGNGSYNTLKAAFDAINNGIHTGSVTIVISGSTTETTTATLNASGMGNASYSSVHISPSANVTVSGSLSAPIISFNGASGVLIDGYNPNTMNNDLSIVNNSTSQNANTSTIRFINGANNNVITNCNLLGASGRAINSSIETGIVLFSSSGTSGNNNNTIMNCKLGPAGSSLPSRAICSFGSVLPNSNNEISNNIIYDYFNSTYSAGIHLNDKNTNWTINSNKFIQTSLRTGSGTGIHYAILIDGNTTAEHFIINNNTIGYSSVNQTGVYEIAGSGTTFQAISLKSKTGAESQIKNNVISNISINNSGGAVNFVINDTAAAPGGFQAYIEDNIITNISTTGNLYVIAFTGSGNNASSFITGNEIRNINLTSTARFYGILYNGGNGGFASEIKNNIIEKITSLGTASGSATGSPAFNCIYVASGPTKVTNNTIGSLTADSSIFVMQTSGSTSNFDVLGIYVKGADSQIVSNNSIGGIYVDNNAAASGTPRIFPLRCGSSGFNLISENLIGGSSPQSIYLNSTSAGASILGVYNNAGSTTFSKNQFRNITSGAGKGTGANSALVAIYNASNNNTIADSNIIYSLSSTGVSVGGIIFSTGTLCNISNNTVYDITGSSTTATPVVTGIEVNGGVTTNVYNNKIYNIKQLGAVTTDNAVNGLLLSAGTSVTAYNNIIGNLFAGQSETYNAINGINISSASATSEYKIYYNSVYLNATSSGSIFGTSALYHAASPTPTTASLDLKNNILINKSTAKGSGATAAFRRSSSELNNYNLTANNNLFYSSSAFPASSFVYYTPTNQYQNISDYKAHAYPRDSASVTEDVSFVSTTGSDNSFLHINPTTETFIESGGVVIPGINDDFDKEIRQGSIGYSGTGSAPDIGADEGEFTAATLPVKLLNFSGVHKNGVNLINWKTAMEVNNKAFVLEKSNDGKIFKSFITVASKAENGTSAQTISYNVVDENPPAPVGYYRLKQIEKDGKEMVSGVLVIRFNKGTLFTVSSLYPNPSKNMINLSVTSANASQLNMMISDVSGRPVMQKTITASSGNNLFSIPVSHLSKGVYIITMMEEKTNTSITIKFIKE